MMDDFTDDLLALAGDGEDAGTATSSPAKHSSPQPVVASPSARPTPASSQPQKGIARKMNKRAKSKSARTPLQIHEDEPSPPPSEHGSLGSGAMSESTAEVAAMSPTPPADGSRYPIDGKFVSVKDREEIMAMPEARREQILSERMEELEQDAFNKQLRQRHDMQQKEQAQSADKKKRKFVSDDPDEPQRKITKQKTKQNEVLEGYKKQREQRNDQRQKEDDRRTGDKKTSPSGSTSGSRDNDDSEVDWDEDHYDAAKTAAPEAPLRHIERSRLGRTRFAAVCYVPGFEEAIKGCYTRVNIGPDPQAGENQYRMVRIMGFKPGRPYAVEGTNEKIFYTDQYAVCASGKSEKDYPFIFTSDGKFTDREYEQYRQAALADKIRMPTIPQVDEKLNAINGLLNHRWLDLQITQKLNRQQDAWKRLVAADRDNYNERRARALARGDNRQVQELDQKLHNLEQGKTHPRNGAPVPDKNAKPAAEKPLTQQEQIALINAKNRKANAEEIRRALLHEKRMEQKRQAAIARGEASANPFARVKTFVKTHHDANNANDKKLDDLFESGRSRSTTPMPKAAPEPAATNGATRKKKRNDDDIIGALDIEVDIDI